MESSYIFRENLFKGYKFIVSGATSGIGYESVRLLSNLGADIIILGRSQKKLKDVQESLKKDSNIFPLEADLSTSNAFRNLIISLPDEWLPINGLFHSAGDILLKPLSLSKQEDFDYLVKVSLTSILNISALIAKKKYFDDKASIVLMSSISSLLSTMGLGYYSAVKSSINSICRSMAVELSSREIRVNAILAGAIETKMHSTIISKLSSDYIQKYQSKHLLGFGKPIDIANMVSFLLSPASSWITGSSIVIDGGYSAFK